MYIFHSSVLFIICMGSYVQFYQKNFLRLFFPKAVTRRLSFALLCGIKITHVFRGRHVDREPRRPRSRSRSRSRGRGPRSRSVAVEIFHRGFAVRGRHRGRKS